MLAGLTSLGGAISGLAPFLLEFFVFLFLVCLYFLDFYNKKILL